jgi:hypothetical protein
LFCTSRRLIRRKCTVTYQRQYFTINSSISECDNKYETRNAELEIATDGSSQTQQNPQVDGDGSGFDLPRVRGSGFWPSLKPNRPVFVVQTWTAVAGKSVSHHHRHSAWQRTELRRVYGDTGMMETDWATGAYGDQWWRR